MTATNRLFGPGAVSSVLAAAAMLVLAWPTATLAQTAQLSSLRDALFGAPPDDRAFQAPKIARFQAESVGAFVLDRSNSGPVLMKFEDSIEIWALEPHTAPRGDIIYKNDMGEPVLRATRVGGLTLFTTDQPGGVAAAFNGLSPGLRLQATPTPGALLHDFALASARASRAAQKLIAFEATEVPMSAAALFADAARVTSEAFIQMAGRGERERKQISRYSKVEFGAGSSPDAATKGQVVRITIAPDRGFAGRP
jgi:hypothetical protein